MVGVGPLRLPTSARRPFPPAWPEDERAHDADRHRGDDVSRGHEATAELPKVVPTGRLRPTARRIAMATRWTSMPTSPDRHGASVPRDDRMRSRRYFTSAVY